MLTLTRLRIDHARATRPRRRALRVATVRGRRLLSRGRPSYRNRHDRELAEPASVLCDLRCSRSLDHVDPGRTRRAQRAVDTTRAAAAKRIETLLPGSRPRVTVAMGSRGPTANVARSLRRGSRPPSDREADFRLEQTALRGSLEVFDLAHPAGQWVPSGENLGHHLQVVDSKRLKSPTHSVDRTAITLSCCRCGASVVQRCPEPLRHGLPRSSSIGCVGVAYSQGEEVSERLNRVVHDRERWNRCSLQTPTHNNIRTSSQVCIPA
jgi:hypothetical protein